MRGVPVVMAHRGGRMIGEGMKDGGPAFPQALESSMRWNGMTLRDYFAAAAIQGLMTPLRKEDWPRNLAVWAYEMADAMILERAK